MFVCLSVHLFAAIPRPIWIAFGTVFFFSCEGSNTKVLGKMKLESASQNVSEICHPDLMLIPKTLS